MSWFITVVLYGKEYRCNPNLVCKILPGFCSSIESNWKQLNATLVKWPCKRPNKVVAPTNIKKVHNDRKMKLHADILKRFLTFCMETFFSNWRAFDPINNNCSMIQSVFFCWCYFIGINKSGKIDESWINHSTRNRIGG